MADQVKYKYWNNTDIIFHSREISRKERNFSLFKDKGIYDNFIKDLRNFLLSAKFKMFFIVVDKEKARKVGWNDIKIYKDTTSYIVRNFLLTLLTIDARGEMIIESATAEKDKYLLDAFSYFLAAGIPDKKIDFKIIQDTLSSVSFVTKRNNDIEEQISDLFGYAAKLKYLSDNGQKFIRDDYSKMILEVLNTKIFKVPKDTIPKKTKLFEGVEPFHILP